MQKTACHRLSLISSIKKTAGSAKTFAVDPDMYPTNQQPQPPRFSACFPSPNRNFRAVYSKLQELVPFSEFRDACHIYVLLSDSLRRDIESTQLTLPPQMEPQIFARNTAFSWLRIEIYSKPNHRLHYRLFSAITNGNNRNAGKNTDSSKEQNVFFVSCN